MIAACKTLAFRNFRSRKHCDDLASEIPSTSVARYGTITPSTTVSRSRAT